MSEVHWIPIKEEREYVSLLASMALDTLAGTGVVDKETFISNLRVIAENMVQVNVSDETETEKA